MVYIKSVYKNYVVLERENIGEIKMLNITVERMGQKFLTSAIYRSPATNPNQFVENLNVFFDKIKSKNVNFHFFVGDVNIDIKSNTECLQDYLNLLSQYGFKSLINAPTRVQNGSKSCIDHIFLKGSEQVDVKSFIIHSDITDHFPVAALLKARTSMSANKKDPVIITKIDEKKLVSYMQQKNWEHVYNSATVEEGTCRFVKDITNIIDRSKVKIKLQQKFKKRHSWITQGLMKSVEIKQKLYIDFKNDQSNREKERNYKVYINKLNKLLFRAKNDYFRRELEMKNGNSKSLWYSINKFTGKCREQNTIKEIHVEGRVVKDNNEMANAFNKYYANVGKNLASKIKNQKHF